MSQQIMIEGQAKKIANAIAAVLDQLYEHDLHRAQLRQPSSLNAYSLQQFSEAVERGDFFLEDPVGYGLRKAVRKAGELAARQCPGDLDRIADYAACKDGTWSRWRSIIIDKNFDGLTSPCGEVLWLS